MIAFIVVMACPPHAFTPAAKGLLAAFLILYFGSAILGIAWGLFVDPFLYRMWLASFQSDWVEKEDKGWWGRYVRMERSLGRIEHFVYTWIKRIVQCVRGAFTRRRRHEEVHNDVNL